MTEGTFPQFYLHYDIKQDRTIKVDRSNEVTEAFTLAIPLEESISRRLLSGEINESNLIVNKYAECPYVIEKALFPKNAEFFFIFSLDTLKIQKVVVNSLDAAALQAEGKGYVKIESRAAFSVLAGDTNFNDWEIVTGDDGEIGVVFCAKDSESSSLFKNRTDFLSLAEIDPLANKDYDKNTFKKLCEITVNYIDSCVIIDCASLNETDRPVEHFSDFFIAVTNKNDPSFLIKKIDLESGKKIKLEFVGKRLENMSFFTSRFHLRSTKINVVNKISGEIRVTFDQNSVEVENDLVFGDTLPNVKLVLKNKYDQSAVYRTIKLTEPGKLRFSCPSVDPKTIDVDSINISKKFIRIIR